MTPTPPDRLVWLGHSTVLLELGGVRILTDPLLRARMLHLVRHAPPAAPAALGALDAVAISHLHLDHLDLPSLRRLGTAVPIIVPRGAGRLLARAGFTDVAEIAAGETHAVGGVRLRATPAEHDDRRLPGGPRAKPVNYVVDGPRARVAFAGDTALFPGLAELGDPPPDVALLPIWGWGPRLGPGHLDPADAARAAALIGPRIAVPIHWGTYVSWGLRRGRRIALVDAPRRFAHAAARLAPDVTVAVLAPGGTLALSPSPSAPMAEGPPACCWGPQPGPA